MEIFFLNVCPVELLTTFHILSIGDKTIVLLLETIFALSLTGSIVNILKQFIFINSLKTGRAISILPIIKEVFSW